MKKIIYMILFLSPVLKAAGQQFTISVDGSATFDNSMYSVTEAGEDFPSSVESTTSVFVSILFSDNLNKKVNSKAKWAVAIQKTDINWNNNLIIEAKRTGDGSNANNHGKVKINGGENYQPITDVGLAFFDSKDEVVNIPVGLRLSGASVTMGAKQFETNIILTISDSF
jgi:predicted chitinase